MNHPNRVGVAVKSEREREGQREKEIWPFSTQSGVLESLPSQQ